MSKAPRVSVITVFLNGERFIDEAIRSVVAQRYPDWELLLVDDGSTDGATAIAKRWAAEHPERIRYLEHPGHENRGAAAARNLGLSNARGELIAFLDADDIYLPGKLIEQVPMLDAMPDIAMLYGRSMEWHSWDGSDPDPRRDTYTTPALALDQRHEPPELFIAQLRDPNIYPTTCSVLIRRSAIEAVGGFDERFRTMYEDVVLFMKLLYVYPVYVSSQCWDRYRRHMGSTWVSAMRDGSYSPNQPYASRGMFLEWVEDHLRARGAEGTPAWKAVQDSLVPYRHPRRHMLLRAPALLARAARERAERLAKQLLPRRRRKAMARMLKVWPPVGLVRMGQLRRLDPISPDWGFSRGTPVDRHYIDAFIGGHAEDIRGSVLEIGEPLYTRRHGGSRVTHSDVLNVTEGNPQATIVGDLVDGSNLPSGKFDCIILTQTLQYIYDLPAAIRTLYRILKPGGVILATLPGLSEVGDDSTGAIWHWSFTPASARRVFQEAFTDESLEVRGHGNVLAAVAFLHGLAAEELRRYELAHHDARYPVSTTIRAVKPLSSGDA